MLPDPNRSTPFLTLQLVEGYPSYKKTHPPGTLPEAYVKGPRRVVGGWALVEWARYPCREHMASFSRSHLLNASAGAHA